MNEKNEIEQLFSFTKTKMKEFINLLKENEYDDRNFKYPVVSDLKKEISEIEYKLNRASFNFNDSDEAFNLGMSLDSFSDTMKMVLKNLDSYKNNSKLITFINDEIEEIKDFSKSLESWQELHEEEEEEDGDDREIKYDDDNEYNESLFESYLKKSREI